MTLGSSARDGEVEALVVDRYLDSLLAREPRDPSDVPAELRATAELLSTGLPRYHPSFRFEEALAARLVAAAAGQERTGAVIDFPAPVPDPMTLDARSGQVRPVVIGGLYNGNDKPIFPVAEKTKLGFRSRSVTKGGTADFNEITLDDKKGSEQLFLHAQKDMKTEVENDQTLTVENNRSVTINKGNETVTLKQGDQTTALKLGNISVKCDLGSITMEAMQAITLKVGQSSVKIDQMGVTISGMMIKIDGTVMTEVKGLMTQVKGSAMLQLSGGIIMIG